MNKLSLFLIGILSIQVFCQDGETPEETNICAGFTVPENENEECTGSEELLLKKCIKQGDNCIPVDKTCEEVKNLGEENKPTKEQCEAITDENGYCIKNSEGCQLITACGNQDEYEVKDETICDKLTVSNYYKCVMSEKKCVEEKKSCSDYANVSGLDSGICAGLKYAYGSFCIIKENEEGCDETNICEKVKYEASSDICATLSTTHNKFKCVKQGESCVEKIKSCTDNTIDGPDSEICSELEKSPGNICYFDGESCKEANSCENIINQGSTQVTNDLCNLLSTEDYKCIVDASATNKCRKHFYCEKAPYESENLCGSYLVKTQGKICKKSTNANACVEEEETTSQDGENTQDKENTGDNDTPVDGENTKDKENTGDNDTPLDEENNKDKENTGNNDTSVDKENTGNEGGKNESNSKNNSISNDKAETENGNILKITFSIFCLILML